MKRPGEYKEKLTAAKKALAEAKSAYNQLEYEADHAYSEFIRKELGIPIAVSMCLSGDAVVFATRERRFTVTMKDDRKEVRYYNREEHMDRILKCDHPLVPTYVTEFCKDADKKFEVNHPFLF